MLCLSFFTARLHHVRSSLSICCSRRILENGPRLQKCFTTSSHHRKKPKPKLKSGEDTVTERPKVRWYQQLFPWSTKRTRTDGEFGFTAGEDYDEAKWLKGLMNKYDAELHEMEGRGGKTMVEPLLASLSKEDAQKVREEIRKSDLEDARKEKEARAMEGRLAQLLPKKEELEIKWQLPPEQNSHLKTLNETLFKASGDIENRELRKNLWQSYTRCKAFLPPFLHLVPKKSWDTLWASQQSATPDDIHWAPHLVTLSEDIMGVGKELNVYQKILYIEALNIQNHQEKAIEQWKELKNYVGGDTRASEEHELLGVRLFASHGDPEKAENIALNFLGTDKQEESRILIPILHAWAQRGDDIGIQHAWALYLRFRAHVGANITMDDYDNISMGFLSIGRTDIALAVFKDMMLTGQQTDEGSPELYKKSLGIMGRTQESAITVEDLNRISLTGLTTLPRRFQNKFFYGCWLKKLLGMDAVDAAAQVIELMYERGVKPDTKHLNGIIGARLRAGTDKDREAAEQMAWAMIHKRLDFVNLRRHGHTPKSPKVPFLSVSGLPNPGHLKRSVAPANVETFALLLQHYGRRTQYDNVQLIKDTLELAEIKPNVYFINHVLYIDLRRGQHQAAWIKYKDMFGTTKPDLETFACLWDCEKAHLDSLVLHFRDKFPGPRRIMSEMMNWFSLLSSKPGDREAVQQDISRELYEQILRCFGLASDPEGMIAALYALRESFGFYPDPNVMRKVTLWVSRMKIGDQRHLTKTGRSKTGRNERKAKADKIAQVFALVIQQREVVLVQNGLGDLAQFDEYVIKQEGLFRLAEFLRLILQRTSVDENSIEGKIERAAWDMGVSGISMEDPLPSYGSRKQMYRIGDGEERQHIPQSVEMAF